MHCGGCIDVCPEHHKISGSDMVYLRDGCTACGACAEECPTGALSVCGELRTPGDLFTELRKDLHYYTQSGGGVTFSGGECLLYPEFVAETAEKCRDSGIHTAVESALYVPWKNIERVLPFTDLFFADLKIADPEKHRRYTGQDNTLILENLQKLSEVHDNLHLRIPVIPGVNDSAEDIGGFAEILRSLGKGARDVELLRYNPLAESKYLFSGREYTRFADSAQTDAEMESLRLQLSEKCLIPCFYI
jgi:pyruvate formate lyase activating enzyme